MIKLGCIDQREHFKHEASDLEGNLWEERGEQDRRRWAGISL